MKTFMDKDFLLDTDTAKMLYHDYAAKMPIIDYHCHIDPKEIAKDRHFENITQLWLEKDHYKWRQMRSNGVEEKYITGNAPDREKFQKWAETLEKAIGNPLYHWSHLELQRYFDYHGVLNKETAEEVWKLCNDRLANPDMSARNLVMQSNCTLLCTTDDPIDDLTWHKIIREDGGFSPKVLPSWRPDRAMYIEKTDFLEYLKLLEDVSEVKINSFTDLITALKRRMDFFEEIGCKVADHGLAYVSCVPATKEEVEKIFQKRLSDVLISEEEKDIFQTAFLVEMGKEYHRRNWVMQLHYGVKRNNSKRIFGYYGPDAGVDCIYNHATGAGLADFLNLLDEKDQLPKTIIYSLNPMDNATIGTIIGCFQNSTAMGKIQQGSAWWFNDHKSGMLEQMTSLASLGLLGNFVGMLTDSRSFLSYTRHEYFRRILCHLIGTWVENGEYPADENTLGKLVRGICYDNAKNYFGFEV